MEKHYYTSNNFFYEFGAHSKSSQIFNAFFNVDVTYRKILGIWEKSTRFPKGFISKNAKVNGL